MPGVEVRLQERPERGGYEYANVSDVDGRFPVLEGTESWSLRASAPGFAPTTLRDPMTTIGADGNLHVKLGAPVPRGGTVVDAAGRPVEAARIAFMPKSKEDGYAWTVSDAKGRFRFDDLPADAVGSVDVAPPLPVGSPSEANRTQTDYAFKTEPRPLELLSKHATYKLDWLPVPPGITLNVKVLDEKDGALVPGPIRAMLFANARSARKPERRVDPSGEPHAEVFTLHQSDPGVVRARGIPAGDHSLSIDAPGFALPKRLAITVAESPAAQEVVVRMARGMVLAGKVIVSGNRPGRGLLLVSAVSSEITSQTFECSPEADGSFRLPVPWFGYTVQAFVRDPDGNHLMQSLIVELAEGAAECGKLTLEVKPAVVLRLRIAKELREAGTCVLVRVVDGAERVWFERSSLDANPYVEGGKEGELVANVPEGRYVVQLLAGYGRDREVVKTMNVIAPAIVQITPP